MTNYKSRLINTIAVLTSTLAIAACGPISTTENLETNKIHPTISVVWDTGSYMVDVELTTSAQPEVFLALSGGDKLVFKSSEGTTQLAQYENSGKITYNTIVESDEGVVSIELVRPSGSNGSVSFEFGSRANAVMSYGIPFDAANSSITLTHTGGGGNANLDTWLVCSDKIQFAENLHILAEADIPSPFVLSVNNLLASYNNENGTSFQWDDLISGGCIVSQLISWANPSSPVVNGFDGYSVGGGQQMNLSAVSIE